MMRRFGWLIGLAILILGAIVLLDRCTRDAVEAGATLPPPSVAVSSADPRGGADASTAAAAAERIRQRDEAMLEAVTTLQAYLGEVGAQAWSKADPYWANDRPAANSEADLRKLDKLRALRIENDIPKPLDSEPVPNALEIPVELRATVEGEAQRRYRGWYRMRRAVADGSWEITSASVQVVTP